MIYNNLSISVVQLWTDPNIISCNQDIFQYCIRNGDTEINWFTNRDMFKNTDIDGRVVMMG
jgi:hypothetical protein